MERDRIAPDRILGGHSRDKQTGQDRLGRPRVATHPLANHSQSAALPNWYDGF